MQHFSFNKLATDLFIVQYLSVGTEGLETNFVLVQYGTCSSLGVHHRSRIDLEDKAKVFTSDWGTESLPR